MFPVEIFDIEKYLEMQFFYGIKHRFYIWPGFFFIRMDYLQDKKVDFRPSYSPPGDTGGGNGKLLFKNIDFNNYQLVEDEKRFFDATKELFGYGYSYFSCGWIHCWNASNYMGLNRVADKMKLVYEMLEERLK